MLYQEWLFKVPPPKKEQHTEHTRDSVTSPTSDFHGGNVISISRIVGAKEVWLAGRPRKQPADATSVGRRSCQKKT